jgi:formylmethanofuran dehydrogenase subunit E
MLQVKTQWIAFKQMGSITDKNAVELIRVMGKIPRDTRTPITKCYNCDEALYDKKDIYSDEDILGRVDLCMKCFAQILKVECRKAVVSK